MQGSPSRANLGNFAGALASHGKALAIRARLAASTTASPSAKLELARSYAALGELAQVTSDIPAALASYRKAFAVFDSMTTRSAEGQRGLGVLDVRFGRALAASGELGKAIESYRKGIALTLALSAADPGDRKLKRDLAIARIALGDALADSGDLHEALESHRSALALFEPLVTPTDAPSRRDVNTAQGRISDTLAKMGDKRGALAIELEALGVSEELLKADPSNALAARDTYIDYYKTAFLQEALGDVEAAIANQRRCIVLCEAQVKANPASSQLRGDLSVGYFRLGEMLEKRRDRLPEARRSYREGSDDHGVAVEGGSLRRGRARRPVGGHHEAQRRVPEARRPGGCPGRVSPGPGDTRGAGQGEPRQRGGAHPAGPHLRESGGLFPVTSPRRKGGRMTGVRRGAGTS